MSKVLFGMKISHEKPPIYDRLVEAFGIDWNYGIVITYGDTLHTREGNNIPQDLVIHERTHTQQAIYSTFHDALTQICYGCQKIRTTL